MSRGWNLKFVDGVESFDVELLIDRARVEYYTIYLYEDDIESEADICFDVLNDELLENEIILSSDEKYEAINQICNYFNEFKERHSSKQVSNPTQGVLTSINAPKRIRHDEYIVEEITNNQCYLSQYFIDRCIEKLRKGYTQLLPGQKGPAGVPKNLAILSNSGDNYYGKIKAIKVMDSFDFDEFNMHNSVIIIGIKTSYKNKIIFFEIETIYESMEEKTNVYYKWNKFSGNFKDNVPVMLYSMDESSIHITNSIIGKYLSPALNYYTHQFEELNKKSETVKVSININLLRDYYEEFKNLVVDNDLLVLPVIGKASRLRSMTVLIEDFDNKLTKYDFYEGSVNPASKEEKLDYLERFESIEVKLPKDIDFVIVDLVDLSQKDGFLFRKIIADANSSSCTIVNNIEGDKVRIRRIVDGITSALRGNVANENLVEMICKNDIHVSFDARKKYKKNVKYIGELKKRYPILEKNEEQLVTIDKILQMEDKNLDIMLVQGPPGTGKTELILALAKELSRAGHDTLITSNVHVACDNIVERLKNNKDLVLKRYTSIRGEQYENEVVENKRKYVENQVLEGFKYKDLVLNSKEKYKKVKSLLDEAYLRKKQIEDSKIKYDSDIKVYKDLTYLAEILERQLLNIRHNISYASSKMTVLTEDIKFIESYLNEIANTYNDLCEKQSVIKERLNNNFSDCEKLSAELNLLLEKVSKDEELIENKKNENIKLANDNSSLETEKSIKNQYQEFLMGIDERIIRDELISHYINKKPFSSPYFSQLVNESLLEVEELFNIYSKLKNDSDFWNTTVDIGLQTLEYLYFTNERKAILPKFLNREILSLLSDVYLYSQCPSIKKCVMAILPFVKYNERPKKYYDECLLKIIKELKKVQFYYSDYIEEIISCNISNIKLEEMRLAVENRILEIDDNLLRNRKSIEDNMSLIEDTLDTITKNNKIVAKKQRELLILNNTKSNINNELAIVEKQIEDNVGEKINYLNLSSETEVKSKELLSYILSLVGDYKLKTIEIEENNNRIDDEFNKNPELISNYDVFINKMNFDLKRLEKEINIYEIVLERFNQKLNEMLNNGWDKESALEFMFDYVDELEKISNCSLEKVEQYLSGKGEEFHQMFLLSDKSNGSLVSMTTNQVASLFYNVDKELIFDYAIIDEASKCKFEDLIISLPRIRHLVLIGDFMQLDPMYDQYKNIELKYQNMFSLEEWDAFNRSSLSLLLAQMVAMNENKGITSFDENPEVAVMKRQYRMNKGIYSIIEPIYSIHDGFELIDAKETTANDVKCINIDGSETQVGTSQNNMAEGDAIVSFLKTFQANRDKYSNIKTIGIITGYKAQENYLRRKLKSIKIPGIQIGTFDRFQGREYDLVIVSLVRSVKLGFTNNIRRMNVAFSRAKNHLLIFGNFDALNKIALKTTRFDKADDYSNNNIKENTFVVQKLIPYLYKIREDFISDEERVESIMKFLKENDYE